MDHLDDVPLADFQRALGAVDGKTPALRLVVAIANKRGVTQTELAAWFGVERRTVYVWLERFADGPLAEGAQDEPRPGRPRKLDADEWRRFERAVRDPPAAAGYDTDTWSPDLARRFLAEAFDVEYSVPSCRRLLREACLEYRPVGAARGAGAGDAAGTGGGWVPRG